MRFQDQIIAVTGGSTGIGYSAAEAFIAEGASRVYITGRTAATLTTAANELGNRAVSVIADVGTTAGRQALKAAVEANGDHLDVLFANAGIAEFRSFEETDEALFDRVFDINVKGVYFTIQTLLPLIRDGGSIVLTGSISGYTGMANTSIYSATKAAVRSFARTLASDLKDRKIRVNTLSPGATLTPIFGKVNFSEAEIAGFQAMLESRAPAGRIGRPEEVAAAALFLASPQASYVNGVDFSVDGGLAQV